MAAPRASVAVTVTRAGLTVAAALALTRVFAGRSWLFALVLAAVVPPAVLAFAERNRWPVALRVAVVTIGGIWLAALVAEPSTTVLGVPTRATIASLFSSLGDAPHTLRSAVVPVSPTGAALVLAFVGVYAAAALTHWIATSLEAPIGAFAPSIALFIVVAAVGEGSWVFSTALYALAGLAYLLSLAQNDLLTRRTWFHASAPHAPRVAAGGVAIGAIAVIAALVVGPSVPGAGGEPLVDYKDMGSGSGGNSIISATPPILTIKDKLTLGPTQVLFTVRAPKPAYWRVIALDWFTNGQAWGINQATEESIDKLDDYVPLSPTESMHQRFQISQLDPHWLPAAFRPVGINLTAARFIADSVTLLVDSREPLEDLVYDVDSEIPTPSVEQLRQTPESSPIEFARLLDLPSDLSQPVRDLALELTAEAPTPYDRAIALLDYFRKDGNFTYSTKTDLSDSPDAITEFLTETKTGFCEQFAASYAALARVVGLPSRVAVGYQFGELNEDGSWHVTNRDSHAWPEVWFDGVGWIPFEPTPGFAEPTNHFGTAAPANPVPNPNASTSTSSPTATSTPVPPTIAPPRDPINVQQPTATEARHGLSPVITGILIVASALLLGVLGFAAYAVYTLWRRAQRRRHAKDPRNRVLGAWNEALDHLHTAGVPPKPAATSLEFATRYAPAHGAGTAGGPALMELARLQSAAMYSDEPPTPDEASFAWEQADTIRDTVRRTIARPTRWRRRLRQLRPAAPAG